MFKNILASVFLICIVSFSFGQNESGIPYQGILRDNTGSELSNTSATVQDNKKEKEKGCTEPLYGKKARCILNIVPQEEKGQSIQIDKKCIKTRE